MEILANKEIEYSVLGSVLLDNTLYYQINILKEKVFNFIESRELFKAIKSTVKEYEKVDLTLIASYININKDNLKGLTTITQLMEIQESVASTANFNEHLDILIDYYNKREMKRITQSLDMTKKSEELKEEILNTINEVFVEKEEEQETSDTVMNRLEEILMKKKIEGVQVGLGAIDVGLRGFRKGELWTLVAQSGMGKTATAVNMFRNAINKGSKALYFSLEVPKEDIINRMAAAQAGISFREIRDNNTKEEDEARLIKVFSDIASKEFKIIDNMYRMEQILSKVKIEAINNRADIIFIDQLSLISASGRYATRTDEENVITGSLKRLAMEIKKPIVLLVQVNLKKAGERGDKRPTLDIIKGSGKIVEDSDGVIGMYREPKLSEKNYVSQLRQEGKLNEHSPDADINPFAIEMHFLKSRNSSLVSTSMEYRGDIQYIGNKRW